MRVKAKPKPLTIAYRFYFADHKKKAWIYYSTARWWDDVLKLVDEMMILPKFSRKDYGEENADYYRDLFKDSHGKPTKIMIETRQNHTLEEYEILFDKERKERGY